MNRKYKLSRWLIFFVVIVLISSSFFADKNKGTANAAARKAALENYHNNYLGSNVSGYNWNGNVVNCNPGTLQPYVLAQVLKRINYFRSITRLPVVSLDPSYNVKSQKAALMMQANNGLNHHPPAGWKCYSQEGAEGAASSNLAWGGYSNAVTQFMEDYGDGNYFAGHRRWILHSRKEKFGFGSTGSFSALWAFNSSAKNPKLPRFISWPDSGFIPVQLLPDRWSFAIPDADFSESKIIMTDMSNQAVSLKMNEYVEGYGDNTIVWEPKSLKKEIKSDYVYHVRINNVKVRDKTMNFNYEVILFKGE